ARRKIFAKLSGFFESAKLFAIFQRFFFCGSLSRESGSAGRPGGVPKSECKGRAFFNTRQMF
ncbi:MAG: hypothetical protein NC189_06210, partial [Bacteroides sp.]|nr:hypothetical protein [Bacteroides sp.]